MLPTIKLGSYDITRLIIGGNPFSGNSHVSQEMDNDMEDFFTTEQIKQTLFRCEECGINTMQIRADRHIFRVLREYRAEGGTMRWIAQTASEMLSFEGHIQQLMRNKPEAVYLHGTFTDMAWKSGDVDEIKRRLGIIRAAGCLVGLGTHMPAVIERAEEEAWDLDFYMACVYNLSKVERVSSAITGVSNESEPFDATDPPLMYETIRRASKPCLAFKILAAARRCGTKEEVQGCFDEAFANIKETDGVVVGMYPKHTDQVTANARHALDAIGKL